MKQQLKLVALSMSVLGLISCGTAFAATTTTTTTDSAAPVKHTVRHHNKVRHHKVCRRSSAVVVRDYKGMGAMAALPVQPVMVVETPRIDTFQNVMDRMEQNYGRAKPMADWFNRVNVSGGINADVHWGNLSMGYNGENTARLSVNDAYLNLNAHVNDCVRAMLGLSYSNYGDLLRNGTSVTRPTVTRPMPGQYSHDYATDTFTIEQAYVTFGPFDSSPCFPVYFQIGKQFQDYGRYQIHPIERTMAQVMTETLRTSAKLGFLIQQGFHGDIFVFQNPMTQIGNGHTVPIYGASLGWDRLSEQLGFGIGASYISNLTGVQDIANAIGRNNGSSTTGIGTYVHTVGGYALYGDVNSGPFSLTARFTSAIQNFNPADMSSNLFNTPATVNGAKPWAGDITAAYGFTGWNRNQNVYLGYQASNNAVGIYLPKNRWILGYGVEAYRNTNLGLEFGHDSAYSSGNNGSGKSSNTLGARVAVKFG